MALSEEIYSACKSKDLTGETWAELSNRFNFGNHEKLKSQYKRDKKARENTKEDGFSANAESGSLGESEVASSSFTQNDNLIHIVCDSKRMMSQDDIIEKFNIDLNIWRVKSFSIRTSEGYRKDRKVDWHVSDGKVTSGDVEDTGKMLVVTMYHVGVDLVKKTQEEQEITFSKIDEFFNKYQSKTMAMPKLNSRGYDKNGMVLEINLADLHVGNIGVGLNNETSVFDKVNYVVDDVISRIKNVKISKIILVQNGDALHFDTKGRTTTSMTHTVTSDGSTNSEIFDEAARILIMAIDKLEKIAPVEVIGIYGNHDSVSSYMLMKALEFYYRNNKNVVVDAGHGSRKFRKFGNNLVFWQHGEMNKNNVKSLIQREARKEFGETKFAELHLGNYHHQQTLESDGVIIRYLPSITPTDEWHYDNGYTGAIQTVVSFLWDLNTGLREMWFSNIK